MKRLMIAFSFLSAFLPALAAQSVQPTTTLTFSGNDFGGVCPAAVNVTQNVTLNKIGADTVTINSVSIGGANAGDFVITPVTGDGCSGQTVKCDIEITFTPSGLFERDAILTVNASGAGNTNPADIGNLDIPLTGVGEGCGDGIENCGETCDFNNLNDKDCCDGSCAPLATATPIPCADGACQINGTCNQNLGRCQGTSGADTTTSCQDDVCQEATTCSGGNNSSCVQSTPVTCSPADGCHVAGVCEPFSGCTNPAAPDGTTCSIGTCQGGVCTASGGTATAGTATGGTATGGTATGGTATGGTATGGTATGGTATAGTATGGSSSSGCSLSAQPLNGYAIAVWGGILIAVAGIVVLRRRQS